MAKKALINKQQAQAKFKVQEYTRCRRCGRSRAVYRKLLLWITLAITNAAFYTRMVRGNMLETMTEDYIRTARAKGLSERKVVYRHALRASLTPVVTMLGLDVATLLGGAIITEKVFALPGLGSYAIGAITTNDFPAVMGVTILAAVFIVVANLITGPGHTVVRRRARKSD